MSMVTRLCNFCIQTVLHEISALKNGLERILIGHRGVLNVQFTEQDIWRGRRRFYNTTHCTTLPATQAPSAHSMLTVHLERPPHNTTPFQNIFYRYEPLDCCSALDLTCDYITLTNCELLIIKSYICFLRSADATLAQLYKIVSVCLCEKYDIESLV